VRIQVLKSYTFSTALNGNPSQGLRSVTCHHGWLQDTNLHDEDQGINFQDHDKDTRPEDQDQDSTPNKVINQSSCFSTRVKSNHRPHHLLDKFGPGDSRELPSGIRGGRKQVLVHLDIERKDVNFNDKVLFAFLTTRYVFGNASVKF